MKFTTPILAAACLAATSEAANSRLSTQDILDDIEGFFADDIPEFFGETLPEGFNDGLDWLTNYAEG